MTLSLIFAHNPTTIYLADKPGILQCMLARAGLPAFCFGPCDDLTVTLPERREKYHD